MNVWAGRESTQENETVLFMVNQSLRECSGGATEVTLLQAILVPRMLPVLHSLILESEICEH